ncbi:MAG: UDP-N-acetylmuramoyl-L-alanine--D-glutamate ligase [Candidatus Edwardsbacteria bacterium]|jgi:UDP-N-acetylmuramoylalanine--D-glutamate ligase|nr:UDP-N-acetylmuramoyl-L-alanine--D-glutamate ligase [Candidatus Edwardsbacteria bacterium]
MPLDVEHVQVAVIGAGRSGTAAAALLRRRGATVLLSEQRPAAPGQAEELARLGIEAEFGGHSDKVLAGGLIVTSPGVPADLPLFQRARANGIRIISEIELAYLATPARIVAVTGTNGKSTTTSMIGAILAAAGIEALVGGNLAPGRPLTELAMAATDRSVIVAEVSTFQIETIDTFKPSVAVITNISPDHLDRHPGFPAYAALKARLLANQTADDTAVLNADDETVVRATAGSHSRKRWFSARARQESGAWCDGASLRLAQGGNETVVMPASELPVPGVHNIENALAAIAATAALGAAPAAMRTALQAFRGVPHRLEDVATVGGVRYVDNSMCTNAAAGVSSLRAFPQPLVVIAGGRDKGLDLSPFLLEIAARARAAVLIGEVRERLAGELRSTGMAAVHTADDLAQAVRIAAAAARPGDVVILAPGCSSFDMFRDFEERGERFQQLVRELAG